MIKQIIKSNKIIKELKELKLIEFSAVDDKGNFIENADLDNFDESFYSLGLFYFKKELV